MANGTECSSYLNKDFFKTALENGWKTNGIEVHSLDLTLGSSAGDNYSSNIYRASISYTQNGNALESISLIVKSIPVDEARGLVFSMGGPEKEIHFYQILASRFEELLPATKIAPKCYYVTKEPLYTFVFEDLKAEGFTLGKRQRGLNESECKIVLELLGKYHAASMYLLEKEPQIFKNRLFETGAFTAITMDNPVMQTLFVDALKAQVGVVEDWPGYEKYAEKLKNIHSNATERIIEVAKPTNDELKVLAHGDLWVNNIMFKYSSKDELEATDIRFLDFQAFYIISPGVDISYFFNMSVQYDVLVNKRESLIEFYHQCLCATLKNLKFDKIPSLDVIKNEIQRKEFYGFIAAVGCLPIISLDESQSTDCNLELFTEKDAAQRKRQLGCKSVRFEKTMKYLLTRADKLGVLD